MKTYLKYLLLFATTCFILHSCSNDDDENRIKTYTVTYKVYCNTPNVPVRLYVGGETLIIKNYFEDSYIAHTGDIAGVLARCDDKTNLIRIEVYVNGRLKAKGRGNSYVDVGTKLK